MLDARTAAEKAAQMQFADAAQWEYEDEYDDSYDDLAPFGNDGVADVEGKHMLLQSVSSCVEAPLLTPAQCFLCNTHMAGVVLATFAARTVCG